MSCSTRPARLVTLALTGLFSLSLVACGGMHSNTIGGLKQKLARDGDFWQRVDTTSAMWTQGPKAQQMLNRDISRCVTDLSELVRLGQIKAVIPANSRDVANAENEAHANLMGFETPDRDGALLSEAQQYTDFESCMHVKGWERVMNVGGTTADRAATAYIGNHVGLKKWLSTTTTNGALKPSSKGPYSGGYNN
jgi:hypothetical protein